MICESKNCTATGRLVTLFGGLSLTLCNEHVRMWQLEPRVSELLHEHDKANTAIDLLKAVLAGGQEPAAEDPVAAVEEALAAINNTKESARKLAVEMFGLDA